MPLFELLHRARPPVHQTAGLMTPWNPVLFGTVNTDPFPWLYVTEEEALDLPVVGGFVTIMSSLLLQMPLHAYRKVGGDQAPYDIDPPIIVNPTPGPGRTFADFITEYLQDMMLYGNYVAVFGPRNEDGLPDMLVPVPVGQWQIQTDETTGSFRYLINGVSYGPERILHVMLNKSCATLTGKGILQLYKRLIASSVAAERWAALYFDGGAVPPGVIKHPNPDLTQSQADALKAKMTAVSRAREWAVAPGGTELEVLDSDAEGAQLNETRKMNAQQLAMALGIPGALLGLDAPSLTYRNITDVFQQFITTTVMSYLIPLEQQISAQCLPPDSNARFFQANVLRPDMGARVQLANETLKSGLFSLEEARKFFDLGAIHFIETSTSPLEQGVNS